MTFAFINNYYDLFNYNFDGIALNFYSKYFIIKMRFLKGILFLFIILKANIFSSLHKWKYNKFFPSIRLIYLKRLG